MNCNICGSIHGEDRIVERGVSTIELKEAILKGAKTIRKGKIISRHKNLEVIWRKKLCRYFVITTYWRD